MWVQYQSTFQNHDRIYPAALDSYYETWYQVSPSWELSTAQDERGRDQISHNQSTTCQINVPNLCQLS